ncbi:Chitinase [Minicystis rosea]|nr:Chitinase [Minicystis rosea]
MLRFSDRTASHLAVLLTVLLAACAGETGDPHDTTGSGGSGGTSSSSTGSSGGSTTSGPGGGGEGGMSTGTAVANAGPDQSVFRGYFVQLAGSGKVASGTPTFLWTQVSGEPVTLDDPTVLSPSFIAPSTPGPLVFGLVAYDGDLPSMPDEVTIDVVNRSPIANAGPDLGALGGAILTLQGQGGDIDGDPVQYTWTQVAGPAVALSDASLAKPTLVVPEGLTEPLVFALTVSDGFATSAEDWVSVRRLTGPDSDGDLLEDDLELGLGTDPHAPDTDHDGIPDGWEVLGHEGVDYPGLGCDPRHRDLLVELDVHEYETNGVLHSARPSPMIEAAWGQFFADLPLDNPDNTLGVALHVVVDSLLDASFSCKVTGDDTFGDVGSPPNFLFREAFHRVEVCLGDPKGYAQIGGTRINMRVPEPNADPSDDGTEPAAYLYYSIFIHEMGHNLGLRHGGSIDFNYQPTYPSLMNYAYSAGFGPETIEGSLLSFSKGLLPMIDECALIEQGVFAGIPPENLTFLASYTGPDGQGWTVEPDGSVDWNHDGVISSAPYSFMIHVPSEGDPTVCTYLNDNDDYLTIASGLAAYLPSNPITASPLPLPMTIRPLPPSAP